MIFSSISFLILFLPVTVLLYYIVPGIKLKNAVLLLASLIFYGLGEPRYIGLLVVSTLINYVLALLICKVGTGKAALICSVVFNVALLAVFKYIFTELPLPIGISFFTFQILSYDIDVYRDKATVQRNFFDLLLYISFFPQLIAGPIVKYYDIKEQLKNRRADAVMIAQGLRRFIFGLGKKVLISNTIGYVVDGIYAMDSSQMNFVISWTAALLYCLQIYYDFSGYSDMAIGLGKMFGFTFKENFEYPYEASSIKEFWRKWHISLSTWFKEYLYIPLGGNRISKGRTYLNKYIVFFLTGLWHGADITFVIWGLIHGTFSVLEERKGFSGRLNGTVLGHVYTILVVSVAFVFFRSDNLSMAVNVIGQMFGGVSFMPEAMALFLAYFDGFTLIMILIGIIGTVRWKRIFEPLWERKFVDRLTYPVSVVCLLLCIMSLAAGSYNPFIYFRF